MGQATNFDECDQKISMNVKLRFDESEIPGNGDITWRANLV